MVLPTIRTLLVILCICSAAASGALVERKDLLPQHAFLQWLPPTVRSVTVDPQGRPWFMLNGFVKDNELKQQVEQAVALKNPYITGRILLFDSAGRIWLGGIDNVIMGFDPKTKQWIDRAWILEQGQKTANLSHAMSGAAVEDKHGRIFIADMSGCHVFDKGQWTYQSFYQPPVKYNGFPTVLSLDEKGRVYGWSTATHGFWIHDEAGWRALATAIGTKGGLLASVIPLRDGRALVSPADGPAVIMKVDDNAKATEPDLSKDLQQLDSPDSHVREGAQQHILSLGKEMIEPVRKAAASAQSPGVRLQVQRLLSTLENRATPAGVDGYLLNIVRLWGRNREGDTYVTCVTSTTPDGKQQRDSLYSVSTLGKVRPHPKVIADWTPSSILEDSHGRLFLQHYVHGLGVIEDGKLRQLTDKQDAVTEQLLGEDNSGRIFVKTMAGIIAVNPDAPDNRRTLSVTTFAMRKGSMAVCQDSNGRIVAMLDRSRSMFFSIYENGNWREFQRPAVQDPLMDFVGLQPLRNGAIFAPTKYSERVLFYDGKSWTDYATLHEFVEKRHDQILALLTDGRRERFGERGIALQVDGQKNIWCTQFNTADIFDGKQWFTWSSFQGHQQITSIEPYGSDLMLIRGGNRAALVGLRSKQVTSTEYRVAATDVLAPLGGLDLTADSRGRRWLTKSPSAAIMVEKTQLSVIDKTGMPRFEDSLGRIWFVNTAAHTLVLLDRNQQRIELSEPALNDQTTVVENHPGSFWINTQHGLLHLKQPSGAGAPAPDGTYYERGVPKNGCNGLWVDPKGDLWFAAYDSLYQIKLPD